jgi:hypothetical protein
MTGKLNKVGLIGGCPKGTLFVTTCLIFTCTSFGQAQAQKQGPPLVEAVAEPEATSQPKSVDKAAPSKPDPRRGRFFYANDDDWDWASPLGAAKLSKLSYYGKMKWSALDWIEQGLPRVDAVLVGAAPAIGSYLTIDALNELRQQDRGSDAGPNAAAPAQDSRYHQLKHVPGMFGKLLSGKTRPNLIILMKDNGNVPDFTDKDLDALYQYVQTGGRLIVLDDWSGYRKVLERFQKVDRTGKEVSVKNTLRDRVVRLVEQLSDQKFDRRSEAEARLMTMGRSILPILEKLKTADLEAQVRVDKVRARLETMPASSWLSANLYVEQLSKAFMSEYADAQIRTFTRNAQKGPGKALMFTVPAHLSKPKR